VQLPEDDVVRLRGFLGDELAKLRADSDRERDVQDRRLRGLQGECEKLLWAHYADAIPLELVKREQGRITTAIASAEGRLAAIAADFQAAETNLHRALTRAGDCQAAYYEAADRMRRQFNLAFFKRLILDEDGGVSGELAEPFDVILSEELRRAAIASETETLKNAIDQAEHERMRRDGGEPESAWAGAPAAAPDWSDGWSPNKFGAGERTRTSKA
jgi:site-specific DNA recombinase